MEYEKHLSVRLSKGDFEILRKIAEARGIDVSDFVRQCLRNEFAKLSYLEEGEKKALGL